MKNYIRLIQPVMNILLTLVLWMVTLQISAANIFVDQDATGSNNGSSWTNAFVDLQDALSVAASGDLIFVAEGIYKPTSGGDREVSFDIPSGVAIYGGFNGTETAIDQRDIKNNLTVLSGNIELLGTGSDNTYRLLTFINNAEASVVDGFRFQGGNSDDPISYNSGAAVFAINSDVQVRNCEIRNCDGITNLIHFDNSDFLLENVAMHNCTSDDILIGSGSTTSLFTCRNVTIAQNNSVNSAPMFGGQPIDAYFYNCIIYNTIQFANPIVDAWTPIFDHCLIRGGLSSIPEGSGTNIIDEMPQYVDVNGEDFTLQETSPAIDAGLDSHVQTNIDGHGNYRFSGESVDLGAYERSTVTYPIIYVDKDAAGANDGSTWEDAYTDLQDALGVAVIGDYIWVAEGVYKPTTTTDRSIEFILPEGVSIMGGFAGFEVDPYQREISTNMTTLSGNIGDITTPDDNSYHVIEVNGGSDSQVVDGFLLEGANANGTGSDGNWGAMIVSGSEDITVSNCFFQNNVANIAACLQTLNGVSCTVRNSYFINNEALYVYYLQSNGSLQIKNSIMVANTTLRLVNIGVDANLSIEHCTLADNESDAPWGGSGEVVCTNSIVWNTGNGIFAPASIISNVVSDLSETEFGQLTTVTNLINQDPNFLNPVNLNYRIGFSSPAFDAGDPALSTQSKDILGTPRPFNGLPDIGCYEAEECIQLHNFCISAEQIPVYSTEYFNTTRCAEPGNYEPMACNSALSDNVWYRFIAPPTGAVEIFVDQVYNYGAPADLRFAVYDGPCNLNLTEIACVNNYGADETESGIVSGLIPGEEYQLRIEAGPNEEASFNVRVEVTEVGTCLGDFDGDGTVNSGDLLTFLSDFGCTSGCLADLDSNGWINSNDLLEFLTVFGTICP